MEPLVQTELSCYHCGEQCESILWSQDKPFCCYGCQTVFEILNSNDLCAYYDFEKNPGIKQRYVHEDAYAYLDEIEIQQKILTFNSATFSRAKFYIPAIHCVSCIWLLENLQKLDHAIFRAEVNFSEKTVTIDFKPKELRLGSLAKLLASIGYAPSINLDSGDVAVSGRTDKSLIIKIAIAGFCFGNVMLFSFPEYLGLEKTDGQLGMVFSWLNILLSIPVFVYADIGYLTSAWKSFKQRQINIDVPIAVGLVALFLRSVWDIIAGIGPGYLDSFTGLVFFLLIGRWFQNKTYDSLAFDRDFKSYFPLAVLRKEGNEWKSVVVHELQKDDQIKIRNLEIVPADCILLSEEAFIDYSFVTGESKPVQVKKGDLVYAGGKLLGMPVQLIVTKKTSQSQLTSLWNNDVFQKPREGNYKRLLDRAARRFTWVILGLSLITAVYWYVTDASQVWLVITSVLIVACPCALALTAPFTYGNMLRVFGKHKLFLKNADVIERMAEIDAVVFDKTGTVTHGETPEISFHGDITQDELKWIGQLASYSTHPMSKLIHRYTPKNGQVKISEFKEIPGKGIEGIVMNQRVKLGSMEFTGYTEIMKDASSVVFVSVDNSVRGYFSIKTSLRSGIERLINTLGSKCVALLSGDNASDKDHMQRIFSSSTNLEFNQSPHQKLNYINELQHAGRKVMMLGDGLNDAGALKQSNVGIAVTDDTGIFTPASDGILQGDRIILLDKFLALSKSATSIVKWGFVLSFLYNAIALSFAVSGHLTPLVAAILMPLSSISIVLFTTISVNWIASRQLGTEPAHSL